MNPRSFTIEAGSPHLGEVDPVTQSPFRVGDVVIDCGYGHVFSQQSWTYIGGKCPFGHYYSSPGSSEPLYDRGSMIMGAAMEDSGESATIPIKMLSAYQEESSTGMWESDKSVDAPRKVQSAYQKGPSTGMGGSDKFVTEHVPLKSSKPRAQAWLIAANGRIYQLVRGETRIGRSHSNDIVIDLDSTVSREHATITLQKNGYFRLHDRGSKNGTKVNGRRVRGSMMLEPGDVISFGDHSWLQFAALLPPGSKIEIY